MVIVVNIRVFAAARSWLGRNVRSAQSAMNARLSIFTKGVREEYALDADVPSKNTCS